MRPWGLFRCSCAGDQVAGSLHGFRTTDHAQNAATASAWASMFSPVSRLADDSSGSANALALAGAWTATGKLCAVAATISDGKMYRVCSYAIQQKK